MGSSESSFRQHICIQQLCKKSAAMAPMKKAMKASTNASGKMTQSQAYALIGEKTELKAKAVRGVVNALCEVATEEVKKSGVFAIPGIATLKLKTKPATKATTRMMFGKETKVAAKPARKVVKAFPKKSFKEGCA